MKEVLMRTVEEAKALISKVSIRVNTQSGIVLFNKGQYVLFNLSL